MPRWDGVQELIGEVHALKRQDAADEAQSMLIKVYRYVAPIMRRRSFRVHRLHEFLPRNGNLLGLNVNRGQRINLRLREHHDARQFLPFESVLGTMLHELCHNVYGPHDHKFFGLLNELTTEMEDMIAKGYRGDEFTAAGAGRRLATSPAPRQPYKKPVLGRRSPGPGRKLGGLGGRQPTAPQGIRERALQAAELRREADQRCRAVNRAEDLASDEEGDVVEISPEEFNSPKPTPREPPRVAPTPPSQNTVSSAREPETVSLLSDEPEVISLLSDEE